jgi:S1-C subfamily serine protease
LLDSGGRVIGLNTAIYSPSGASAGIGFAVPVSAIRRVVPEIIEHGHVSRAGFGVTLLNDAFSRRYGIEGVVIRDVSRQSAAARAGLSGMQVDRRGNVRLGDILVEIDGKRIRSYDDMYQALDAHKAGDRVKVRVQRDNRTREVDIVLQEVQN